MTASLFLVAVLAAPPVEISTLRGEAHQGELVSLTADRVSLRTDEGDAEFPVSELLELRFPAEDDQPADAPATWLTLTDGTRLAFGEIATSARQATVENPRVGRFKLPLDAVSTIRFAPADSKEVARAWEELAARKPRRDLLVVRKGNLLDHLEGVVGDVDEEHVRFLLAGDEIPVARERVFGVVFAREAPAGRTPACELRLAGGGVLQLRRVEAEGSRLRGALLAGTEVEVPLEAVRALDFSLGKVSYLSQMEPREMRYTPYFDEEFTPLRDRNLVGEPLRVGDRTFTRGMWIHSKTLLKYRLAGEFRRFQAVMGIDYLVGQRGLGDVHVTISGDGRPLFEGTVRGTDSPRDLDLDVAGVRELEILVDFGADLHIADHLVLGDAKVIK